MLGGTRKRVERRLEEGSIRALVEIVFGTHCLQDINIEENV
jgi:hypothetical protein